MKHTITLNCDLGESFGVYQIGNDEAIIPLVDEVNIACGFHAGDAHTMQQTIQLAKQHGVKMGAHPGLPDLQGFGRRVMQVTAQEVYDWMIYQIGALQGFARVHKVSLHHVKPHGALYNMACQDKRLAQAIAQAVVDLDQNLTLVGLSGSELINAGIEKGLAIANEVFADRRYQSDGTLVPRHMPGAVLAEEQLVLQQVGQMVQKQTVTALDGQTINIVADTICVHGDTANALHLVRSIRSLMESNYL
ncbi:5-oxoprolinase subunit PxpA [Gracilibacillus alcaliphilus]|uniref:5-oxoprolinase subunit PxpA n=1 Tax=Gracilibacillus alcaliphilus TaxID=1401441 RepID=UPI0019572408|nr:5-oxoprolinase subunit PxpA [Gracilibacillus alcaliphilus]MBM7679528.1 UPF0271 protein [Gracilibacillus alcaliphilus]